ncbi:MAG TPA: malto-oligosyltrehalose synthase [Candidatus Binatia bacterium]|jgi:(1->4)-alpha-D-glucan 1-alpha-D-glucosylmutase|nr:malto-oligosyltrehalose synthase [Candidatus Binatia bacterium]
MNFTYRLQLHAGFGFAAARDAVPYLHTLGVTHCYLSPILRAGPGSTHGYDTTDHAMLNPELGSDDDFAALASTAAEHGMGLVVDIVPNHMSADAAVNRWWRDVLRHGRASLWADAFDIDWEPVKDELHGRILLPVLGASYGEVLERGDLELALVDGEASVRGPGIDVPIDPRELPRVFEPAIDALQKRLGDDDPAVQELQSIVTSMRHLPARHETDPTRMRERQRETDVTRERLRRLLADSPDVREHIDAAVVALRGTPGRPETFDALHELLETQAYRLAHWRTASHEINYRRFFDVNGLAGLRMEVPAVFDATHALVGRLVADGRIAGLRIDHIDGLFDPEAYLNRLRSHLGADVWLAVEKILGPDEQLPRAWPIAGTSGYDFLNDLSGVFVDGRGRRALLRTWQRFTRSRASFDDVVLESKRHIMDTNMASELNVLARALNRLSERGRRTRDFTLNALRQGLREVVAAFPVYRTYVTERGVTATDRAAVATAVARARRRNPTFDRTLFTFLEKVLLAPADLPEQLAVAMKVQQYTAPVQAKGVEDTAFYRWAPLASLNEVGGDPDRFGLAPAEFHARNARRRAQWPQAMLATSTHDTKRGEDARARLHALSELPREWSRNLSAWARTNGANRTRLDDGPAPARADEYLVYQTLLGIWPPGATAVPDGFVDRVREYLLKAVREAKVHTSWTVADDAYEAALVRFAERTLTGPTSRRFLAQFLPFAATLARAGMVTSLAQVVLKLVSPGVPDVYQGTELWDLTLVDPDNRRPVDFERRRRELDALDAAGPSTMRDLVTGWHDGRVKLAVTARAGRLRRDAAALFLDGSYEPLDVTGAKADHVVAVARRLGDAAVVAIVPRLAAGLMSDAQPLPLGPEVWGDTRVATRDPLLRDVFTGTTHHGGPDGLAVADVLVDCPVALLYTR